MLYEAQYDYWLEPQGGWGTLDVIFEAYSPEEAIAKLEAKEGITGFAHPRSLVDEEGKRVFYAINEVWYNPHLIEKAYSWAIVRKYPT